jgi:hypothetical protein
MARAVVLRIKGAVRFSGEQLRGNSPSRSAF